MKPFRLILEFGNPTGSTPSYSNTSAPTIELPAVVETTTTIPTKEHADKAWELLVDARTKLVEAVTDGKGADIIEPINQWIGGGLAVMAVLTEQDVNALLGKLKAEVPTPEMTPFVSASGNATFFPAPRERPTPPPGAPRDLDPADLSPEEREALGIILPEDGSDPVLLVEAEVSE